MTNNPFIDQSASAYSRFPDISSPGPASTQYTSWVQPPGTPGAYGYSLAVQPTGYVGGYQQASSAGWGAAGSPGMTGLPYNMQGASGFQQQQGQAMGYGVAAQQQSQFAGYPGGAGGYSVYQAGYSNTPSQQQLPQQQQQQQPPSGYLAEFDPYADLGRGWSPQSQSQPQPQGHARSSSSSSASGWKATHPREYIRQNKAALEGWDGYAWKQLENACEVLKDAWAERKGELEGRISALNVGGGGWYGVEQERVRLRELSKEADGYYGAIAASAFQLHEVFMGYRQSSDMASRQRVREAVNAAVQSMPDWPSKVY